MGMTADGHRVTFGVDENVELGSRDGYITL
jgi:hypothetical protein